MKKIFFCWAALFLVVFAQDKVIFNQNEEWFGRVKEFDGKEVLLESDLVQEVIKFKSEGLKALSFEAAEYVHGEVGILLVNGDRVVGELVGLSDNELVVKTAYLGELTVARKGIIEVNFLNNSDKILVDGISKNNGWVGKIEEDNLVLQNADRVIESKSPVKISAVFNLNESQNFRFSLSNYSAEKNPDGRLNTSMQFYTSQERVVKDDGTDIVRRLNFYSTISNDLERLNFNRNSMSQNNHSEVNLELYLNPLNNFMALVINNEEIGKVNFKNSFELNHLLISIKQYNGKLRVPKFLVEVWDGEYDGLANVQGSVEHDNLFFRNGDVAYGKILGIKSGAVEIETKLGKQAISTKTITKMTFKNSAIANVSPNLVYIRGGQSLSGQVEKLDSDFVYLKNSFFGEMKVVRKFVSRLVIQKNIDEEPAQKQAMIYVGKNIIFGEILELNLQKLKLLNRHLVEPLEVKINDFSLVQLNQPINRQKADSRCIELVNGDLFFGEIESLKEGKMVLNSNLGKLSISQSYLARIYIPKGFNSNNYVEIKSGEKLRINFILKGEEISSNPSNISLGGVQMRLFGDNKGRNSYYFRLLQEPSLYFTKIITAEKIKDVRVGKTTVDVSLKIDKKLGVFELYLNGEKCYVFKDPDGFQGGSNFCRIYYANKIMGLHIEEDGQQSDWQGSYIVDKNWQKYVGDIKEISEGKILIGEKILEIAAVDEIVYRNEVINNKQQYRLTFVNGEKLTVEEFSLKGDELKFKSQLMGELLISKKYLWRIEQKKE